MKERYYRSSDVSMVLVWFLLGASRQVERDDDGTQEGDKGVFVFLEKGKQAKGMIDEQMGTVGA